MFVERGALGVRWFGEKLILKGQVPRPYNKVYVLRFYVLVAIDEYIT